MRILIALVALAAAGPLHAQSGSTHRFDGEGFTIELPRGIPELTLVNGAGNWIQGYQMYMGAGADGVVTVFRTWRRAIPRQNLTEADQRVLRELQSGGGTADSRGLLAQSLADTSETGRRAYRRMAGDTSIAFRRDYLTTSRAWFARSFDWIALAAAPREIVTAERVALRSPVTLDLEDQPLPGTADAIIPRSGEPEMWVVTFTGRKRTAELDAAAARVLDSFRVTAAPPPAEEAPAGSTRRFEGDGYTLELPPGIPDPSLMKAVERPTEGTRLFVGVGRDGAVLVWRMWANGVPENLSELARRAQPGATAEERAAERRRLLEEARIDTSAAGRRAWDLLVSDTTLHYRRTYVRMKRAVFARMPGWIALDSATREIVLPERVTLRSAVTLTAEGQGSMSGIADYSMPRSGAPDTWLVAFVTLKETPEFEAAASRVLDSFRITGAPPAPAPPPGAPPARPR